MTLRSRASRNRHEFEHPMTNSDGPEPGDGPRYAIYFAPAIDDPLWAFGSAVLGRDAARDRRVPYPAMLTARFANWAELVQPATHYGFHATLKAPFELAAGIDEARIKADTAALARSLAPVDLGRLAVTAMGRFVTLRPATPSPALQALAGAVVENLDHLRARLTEADRTRRKPETLTPKMRAYLDRWGYPYVLDEFRFHMTLSGPLGDGDRSDAAEIIGRLFQSADHPVRIADLCVFRQFNRKSTFSILSRHPVAD
jgi:putative phosphonate metabolism protein